MVLPIWVNNYHKLMQHYCRQSPFVPCHQYTAGLCGPQFLCPKKIDQITNWPTPQLVTDIRVFLGPVCYIADFLPSLADHTRILTPLTHESADCYGSVEYLYVQYSNRSIN